MAKKTTAKQKETTPSATAKVLGVNLTALMGHHAELNSNPKVSKKTKLGTGTISRIRNGEVDVNLKTLEKLEEPFEVKPWELLVPGFDPANRPTLQPMTEQERKLYAKLAEVVKEIR